MDSTRLICGNEITPKRVDSGLELSEGMASKTELLKGMRSGREQS